MPTTSDYQREFERARRAGFLTEGRQVHSRQLAEAVCKECGADPCECEDCDVLEGRIPRESLEVMEILAATDPHTFTFMVECEGFRVSAVREQDPLQTQTLPEDVEAVASCISDDVNDPEARFDSYQSRLIEMANEYGYIVNG
jgi:hypothetical protein